MMRDLDRTLEAILTQPRLPPELSLAQISFDRPADPFTPAQTTVDLFLYDVHENVDLRSNEPIIERQGNQAVRKMPPLRVTCSYLVTAWPVGGTDLPLQEHRLLSQVLQTLAQFPVIPENFLQGQLAGQEPPLPMLSAHADTLKNSAEFWSSVGNKLRASLTVAVTISMPVLADVTSALVTTRTATVGPNGGTPDTLVQIGGRVTDLAANGVSNAIVDILDAGLRTRTDAGGRYTFIRVPAGTRQFRVLAVGFQVVQAQRDVPGPPENYEFQLTPL